MKAEIISIGDELLIGQTVNTNASWMGKELTNIGVDVLRVTTISDTEEEITEAVNTAFNRVDFILMTGGLGPTKDDITKYTLAKMFNTELVLNEEVLGRIEGFFKKRGREMIKANVDQARLPEACIPVDNLQGTAAGMRFEKEGKYLFSMPGVPYEMKAMMSGSILPFIKDKSNTTEKRTQTKLIQGIGESFLAEKIEDWENKVRNDGFGLAYLPSPGVIRMRMSYINESDDVRVSEYFNELKSMIPKNFIGDGDFGIEEHIGRLLREDNETVGTVESCTAGSLASKLTKHSGSSSFFYGGILTYDNSVKKRMVDVPQEILDTRGAVSEETVKQMAKAGKEKLGVDWCLATSGIAGPTGGTKRKPVGFIWIGLAGPNGLLVAKSFQFGDNRERNIKMAVNSALNFLRIHKLGIQ